jgi:hypothetical protein
MVALRFPDSVRRDHPCDSTGLDAAEAISLTQRADGIARGVIV